MFFLFFESIFHFLEKDYICYNYTQGGVPMSDSNLSPEFLKKLSARVEEHRNNPKGIVCVDCETISPLKPHVAIDPKKTPITIEGYYLMICPSCRTSDEERS